MNNNIKIPGLEDVFVTDIKVLEGGTAIYYVEIPVRTHKCPCCGAKTRKIHDYRIQKIKHLKWFERFTHIFYRKRRYRYEGCGKRFYEDNIIVERYKRTSKEWDSAVRLRSIIHKKLLKNWLNNLVLRLPLSCADLMRWRRRVEGHPVAAACDRDR